MRASDEVVAWRAAGRALWLAVALTACSGASSGNLFPDDARADASASGDVTTRTDAVANVDAAVASDADGGPRDVASGTDVPAADAVVSADVVSTDVPAGRVLSAAGFVTVHAGPQSAGPRRLIRSGFEGLVRSCVGTRCLTGGFLP